MDNQKTDEPDIPATDAEVASAAKQLGLNGGRAFSSQKSRSGQVQQRLAHGRSHTVAVEIKAPWRHKS
jgi:hypothetical protein